MKSLLGIREELDKAVKDLAFFGNRYQMIHPAAGGDISQIFSQEASRALVKKFSRQATKWFKMEAIQELSDIRNDGRTGYRSEGITNPKFYELVKTLEGRVLMITCTDSQIPAILETLHSGEDGKLLNLVGIGKEGKTVRILYGNQEFGTIPSIELHVHMLSGSIGLREGLTASALVHSHPYNLILLGMHEKIKGNFAAFNAVIYTQIEGLNRNAPDLIGVIPYQPSGSATLVNANIAPLQKHQMALWMNHGFVARNLRIERAYSLVAYAEEGAKAARDILQYGGVGLPIEHIRNMIQGDLLMEYKRLKLNN